MGDAACAGQAHRIADFAEAGRITAGFDGRADDLQYPALASREAGLIRGAVGKESDSRRAAGGVAAGVMP